MDRKIKDRFQIPDFIARCLWSYNIRNVDLKEDKQTIITQVLNYGDKRRIQWLYSVYNEEEIRMTVRHPGRGLWFEKVLNFWEKMLDLHIPKKERERAIFRIEPDFINLCIGKKMKTQGASK